MNRAMEGMGGEVVQEVPHLRGDPGARSADRRPRAGAALRVRRGMGEELLETDAVEVPALEDDAVEVEARPLPAPRENGADLSLWRGEVRTAALAAAGGLVAGAATVAAVRASRGSLAAPAGAARRARQGAPGEGRREPLVPRRRAPARRPLVQGPSRPAVASRRPPARAVPARARSRSSCGRRGRTGSSGAVAATGPRGCAAGC